jgi:hypothetical protein
MQGKETEGEERTELRQQEWEEEEEGGEEEEEEEEKDGGHAPPAAKTSFLLDLAIQRNSPRGMVADYVHAFHQLYQEGVVDRQQVLKSMYVSAIGRRGWREGGGGREGGGEGRLTERGVLSEGVSGRR